MSGSLKQKTLHGVIWSGVERFSAQVIRFFVVIILARLLSPKEFGLIAMLTIFLGVSQSLIDSGFSQALIRKQNRNEADNCTVFYFNIVVSVILYFFLFFIAPWVGQFYNEPELCSVMRVVCLIIIINSFAVVQRAIFTRSINFKIQAYATLIAAIISGIIGIFAAYRGMGVWALVIQQIVTAVINTGTLWVYSKWRPVLLYSWRSFKELFSFGSKMMFSGLLDTIYVNSYRIVIGKAFSASDLGYYNNAQHFAEFPSSNFTNILQRVTYPTLCTIQDDKERLAKTYRQLLRLSAFIVFPLMCGLASVASPFIDLVIGSKWHYAATLLVPLCFGMMWYPIHAINLNLLMVAGRSDLFLKLEIIKKILGVFILVISFPFGLLVMCYSTIVSSLLCLIINTYYSGKFIHVGFVRQIRDITPTLLLSISMFGVDLWLMRYIDSQLAQLLFIIIFSVVYYVLIASLFKFKELVYLKSFFLKK